MIHPDTEVRFINGDIGYGVFAKAPIPKGTVVYVKDPLEVTFDETSFQALAQGFRDMVDKYSYIDEHGIRIMSWDNAKYINHRCDCNTISTGYGFEIAIKDIAAGEEMTDDYGLFNLDCEMTITCGCPCCRGTLRPDDLDTQHHAWDAVVMDALTRFNLVKQPLIPYMEQDTQTRVMAYLAGTAAYTSVLALKRQPFPSAAMAAAAMHCCADKGGML